MPKFRYFLSLEPTSPAPADNELSEIVADSLSLAARHLAKHRLLIDGQPARWAHLLVWASASGEQRGFESIRLHQSEERDEAE